MSNNTFIYIWVWSKICKITPPKKKKKCSETAILRFSLNTQSYKHTHVFTNLREEKI